MNPSDRVSTLPATDVVRLVREARDARRDTAQVILALEGSVVELRREAVAGVARQKQLALRLGQHTHTLASRRALEAELAREGRRVIELLQTQIEIETRALALRRERDAMSASPDGRMPRAH